MKRVRRGKILRGYKPSARETDNLDKNLGKFPPGRIRKHLGIQKNKPGGARGYQKNAAGMISKGRDIRKSSRVSRTRIKN